MATDLERLVVRLEASLKSYENQMKKAGAVADTTAKKIESRFAKANANLNGFGANFLKGFASGALGALASLFSVAAIRDATKSLADLGDTADRIGIAVEQLQALQQAADLAGGSAEAVNSGLEKFAKNLSDAGRGTGDLYKVLTANGVALRDNAGGLKATGDMLGVYADLIANAKNPQDQLNLAVMAFGKAAGPELVGLLRQGSAGIAKLAADARATGTVIGEDVVRAAGDLDDKLVTLEKQIGVTFKEFAVQTAPLLVEGLTTINGVLKDISATLSALPLQQMDDFLSKLQASVGASGKAFGEATGLRQTSLELQRRLGINSPAIQAENAAYADFESRRAKAMTPSLSGGTKAPAAGRTSSVPTIIPSSGFGQTNDFERAVKSIKDRTQAIVAETNAQASLNPLVNDYGFAIEKARAQQDLLTAAMDAGIKITPQLKQQIDQLATGYAAVSADAAKLADQQAAAVNAVQFFGDAAYSALDGLLYQGDTLSDVFGNLAKMIGEAALQAALLGQGPLASLLGLGGSGGGAGGIIGTILSAVMGAFGGGGAAAGARLGGIGARASGGPVTGGRPYIVGENGPELLVPGGNGMVVPNHALGRGSGITQITLHQTIDLKGANGDETIRKIASDATRQAAPAILEAARRSLPKWTSDYSTFQG